MVTPENKAALSERAISIIFDAIRLDLSEDEELFCVDDIDLEDGRVAYVDGCAECVTHYTDNGWPHPYTKYYSELDDIKVRDLEISVREKGSDVWVQCEVTPDMESQLSEILYNKSK